MLGVESIVCFLAAKIFLYHRTAQ